MPTHNSPNVQSTVNPNSTDFFERAAIARQRGRRLAEAELNAGTTQTVREQLAEQRATQSVEFHRMKTQLRGSTMRAIAAGVVTAGVAALGAVALFWGSPTELTATPLTAVDSKNDYAFTMPMVSTFAEPEVSNAAAVETTPVVRTKKKPIAVPSKKAPTKPAERPTAIDPLFSCNGDPNDPLNPCLS